MVAFSVGRCWDDAVSSRMIRQVREEAERLWKAAGGDSKNKKARSFWIGLSDEPRCCLERLALEVARFHGSARSEVGCRLLGAEFWVQVRSSEDPEEKQGLTFHFDKDEVAVQEWDLWSHPELGTVTYLTDGGAPLVVFSTPSENTLLCDDSDDEATEPKRKAKSKAGDSVSPSECLVCFPRAGRHVSFVGNFLHGVPQELLHLQNTSTCNRGGRGKRNAPGAEPNSPYRRLSFLVNLWTSHRPTGIRRLSAALAARMCNGARGASRASLLRLRPRGTKGAGSHRTSKRPLEPRVLSVPELPKGRAEAKVVARHLGLHRLSEHLPGDTGPLPVQAVLQAQALEAKPMSRSGKKSACKGLIAIQYRRCRRG